MRIYLIILIGWILGELLAIIFQSIVIQRSSKYKNTFKEAFHIYTTKDIGPIIGSLLLCLIFMFLIPEAIANFATMDETQNTGVERKYNLVFNKVIKWIRSTSVLCGLLSHALLFLIVGRAHKWLIKVTGGESKKDDSP